MLQQTRVDTVVPYYHRFLERFPTPQHLAEADEDAVLSMWSGLGYYRRARLLHAGAREVVARYGGELPRDREDRLALPGIGKYTAGAIGSIAYDRPEPIVDGNVARVLSRVFGIETPLGRAETDRKLWQEAEMLADGERPGALNQGLMELGARVCTPTGPACLVCPIAAHCIARACGRQAELPVPKARQAPKPQTWNAVVPLVGGGRRPFEVWLVRGEGSLFGGLWGVPTAGGEERASVARAALRQAGIRARLEPEPASQLEHILSHRRLDVRVWRAHRASAPRSEGVTRVRPSELAHLGISKLTRRVLEAAAVL
jgi:A/G-specific adenine glycosylase